MFTCSLTFDISLHHGLVCLVFVCVCVVLASWMHLCLILSKPLACLCEETEFKLSLLGGSHLKAVKSQQGDPNGQVTLRSHFSKELMAVFIWSQSQTHTTKVLLSLGSGKTSCLTQLLVIPICSSIPPPANILNHTPGKSLQAFGIQTFWLVTGLSLQQINN